MRASLVSLACTRAQDHIFIKIARTKSSVVLKKTKIGRLLAQRTHASRTQENINAVTRQALRNARHTVLKPKEIWTSHQTLSLRDLRLSVRIHDHQLARHDWKNTWYEKKLNTSKIFFSFAFCCVFVNHPKNINENVKETALLPKDWKTLGSKSATNQQFWLPRKGVFILSHFVAFLQQPARKKKRKKTSRRRLYGFAAERVAWSEGSAAK